MGRDLTAWQDDHRRPLPTTCAKPSEMPASEQAVRTNMSQVRAWWVPTLAPLWLPVWLP